VLDIERTLLDMLTLEEMAGKEELEKVGKLDADFSLEEIMLRTDELGGVMLLSVEAEDLMLLVIGLDTLEELDIVLEDKGVIDPVDGDDEIEDPGELGRADESVDLDCRLELLSGELLSQVEEELLDQLKELEDEIEPDDILNDQEDEEELDHDDDTDDEVEVCEGEDKELDREELDDELEGVDDTSELDDRDIELNELDVVVGPPGAV